MKSCLVVPFLFVASAAASALAGGRPVMYVVVDRVETTHDQSSISMIRIWGSFTRDDSERNQFSKPIDGYIQFGHGSDKEAPKWQKSAGTGKAVVVGSCAGAEGFETVMIHAANEKPKDDGDNIPYPTGHLELFGDMFAGGRDDNRPEVKALLAFVAAKQKVSGSASSPVASSTDSQPVNDALVGQWTVEFANGVSQTCKIREDGTASVIEPRRTSEGNAAFKDNLVVITFKDDVVERWTPVGKRFVVEFWFPGSGFPAASPLLGIADRAK